MRLLSARLRGLACCAALLGVLLLAGGARAATNPVISDCSQHNRLTGHYNVAQLRSALSTLPADVREYTDCYDVIDRQLLGQLGRLSGADSGSGGGSFLPAWLIVVLAVIVLGGAGYAGVALRRRGGGPADDPR